jgi:hypothetical protein
MSELGDARRFIRRAEQAGLVVFMLKHGGYGVYGEDGVLITRIPKNGHAASHWVKRVRRDLAKAGVEL